MNLIRSQVVDVKYDRFWDDINIDDVQVKPVLIIAHGCEPGSAEDQQLHKMLDACKLTKEQYNIVRFIDEQMTAWHKLREVFSPSIIFLIGVSPAQLGISALFSLNVPNNFNDRQWLPTLSIAELEKAPDIKKQLWINGMKPLFIDKPLPANTN